MNMFNNFKIDQSGLVGGKPTIDYDTTILEKDGFKLRYALNLKNPVYDQVVGECEAQNVLYKIVPTENNHKHIWIKE